MASVDVNGKAQIAKGALTPSSRPMSYDRPLEDITVDFGPCGLGKFYQTNPSWELLSFRGFKARQETVQSRTQRQIGFVFPLKLSERV